MFRFFSGSQRGTPVSGGEAMLDQCVMNRMLGCRAGVDAGSSESLFGTRGVLAFCELRFRVVQH